MATPQGGPEPGPAADAALAPARAALHRAWGLASRPLLRLSNAADVDQPAGAAAAKEGARLRDVHHGLRGLVPGGAQTLVQGSYFYYHYMQDKFDDKASSDFTPVTRPLGRSERLMRAPRRGSR